MSMNIGCVIPTYRAGKQLARCLQGLVDSSLKPRILVIDSSSNDGTVEIAKQFGAETLVIPQKEFNHGITREIARKSLGTEIVCMLTQDAYLEDKHTLTHLVTPLIEQRAAIAYGRQIPHVGASFFEAFARHYNYPSKSHLRGIEDIQKFGVYTFFCSNSFAAYSNTALNEIGGFESVLLGEDTVATAKLLRRGYKIAYVAEAVARHSHRYSLWEEFCRNFDTGLARAGYAHLLSSGSSDSKRGQDFAKMMLKQLCFEAPHKIPYGVLHLLFKWSGYQTGKRSLHAPIWFKKTLSSQKSYFRA